MILDRPIAVRDQAQLQVLTDELVAEWQVPHDHDEPIIIREEGPNGQPLRIYVVWAAWSELSQIERSRIIMRAAEEVGGVDLALRITLAMGLTSTEATRLGIDTD